LPSSRYAPCQCRHWRSIPRKDTMSHAPLVIDHAAAPAGATTAARVKPALMASALAVVMLFGMGFAPMEALHNAAHDSRHSAGFPCH